MHTSVHLLAAAAIAFAATSVGASELVTNGDFSAGNTGFDTTYSFHAYDAAKGTYNIDINASTLCGCWANLADHTTGTGKYMIVDGATSGADFFDETVAVVANTNYTLSYWAAQLGGGPQATFAALVNGTQVSDIFTPASDAIWHQFSYTFNSGSATTLTLGLRDLAQGTQYNDFGIDDVSLAGAAPGGVGAVPEPATWALLLSGFAMTGVAVRRRARSTIAA